MTWKTVNLDDTFSQINQQMLRVKRLAQTSITRMASGPTDASYVTNLRASVIGVIAVLDQLKTTPGLEAYVRTQINDANYNAATAFTEVTTALNALKTNIEASMPKDANNYLLITRFDTNDLTERTFSTADTATLRGLLQNVVNEID